MESRKLVNKKNKLAGSWTNLGKGFKHASKLKINRSCRD